VKATFADSHAAMGGMLPAQSVKQILLSVVGCDIGDQEYDQELRAYESNTGFPADLFPPLETIFIAQNALKRNRARTFKKFAKYDAALAGVVAVGRLLDLLRENNHDVGDARFQGMLDMLNLSPTQSLDQSMFVLAYEALVTTNFDYVPISDYDTNQNGPSPEVIDNDLNDLEAADAAVKIQAGFRGFQARKSVREAKEKAGEKKKSGPKQFIKYTPGPKDWDTHAVGAVGNAHGPGVDSDRHNRMHDLAAVTGTGKMFRAEFKGGELTGMQTEVDVTAQPVVRAKKQSRRIFGIRKVNDQARSENVGKQTKVEIKAEFIDREQKAQRVVSKREGGLTALPPGSHGGEFKRAGADISYFNGTERDLIPIGTLDYTPPPAGEKTIIPFEVALDPSLMSSFYHPYLHTKKEATQMLKMSGKDGVFLVRPERHGGVDQPCLSVCFKKKVTHHILSNAGFGTDYVLSCYPFKMKNVTLLGCNTIPLVLEHLRKAYDYWKAPLSMGVTPAKEDVAEYIESTFVETDAEATARIEAYNDTVVNESIPVTIHSSPFNVVNSRAKGVSPEKKRQQFIVNKSRQNKLAQFEDNKFDGLSFTVGAKKKRPPAERILVQPVVSLASGGFVKINATTTQSHSSRENSRPASGVGEPIPKIQVEEGEPAAAPELVDVPEPLEVDPSVPPFSHGEIDKEVAEERLFADDGKKTNGRFLFRDAKGKPGEFILSVVYKGKGTHHAVAATEEGFLTINKMASDKTDFGAFVEYLGSKQKVVKWPVPLVEGVPGDAETAQASRAEAIAAATATNTAVSLAAAAAADAASAAAEANVEVEAESAEPAESAAAARRRKKAEAEEEVARIVPVVNDALSFQRTRSMRTNTSIRHKQFSNINQGASEVPSVPADSVDVKRAGFGQRTAWQSKRQFSNITAGAAKHNVTLDGEAIQREVKAQTVVADILRVNEQITGNVRRDGENADASFFARKPTLKDELGVTDNRVASARNIVAQHGGFKRLEKPALVPKVSLRDRMAALNPTSGIVNAKPPNVRDAEVHVAPPELMSIEVANDEDALAKAAAAESNARAQAAKDAAAAVAAEQAAVAEADAAAKAAADAEAVLVAVAVAAPEPEPELELEAEAEPEPEPEPEPEAGPEPEPEPEAASSGEFEFLHTALNKADSEALLLADDGGAITGKYLLRVAGQAKYVLSVIYKGKPTHHSVAHSADGTLTINGADTGIADMAEFAAFLGQKQKSVKWPVPLVQGVAPSSAGGDLFPYLHAITKGDADALLLADGGEEVTGKYLVRQTGQLGSDEPDSCILSVVFKGKATHHAIKREEGGFLSLNKNVSECTTLEELTTFCSKKQKSIKWPVPLVEGVPRS